MEFLTWRIVAKTRAIAVHAIAALSFVVGIVPTSCDSHREACDGTTCVCEQGSTCTFGCAAPPCYAVCAGDNPMCGGVCGNGDCRCGPSSSCHFECQSPPCHADCASGSTCTATCANGDCVCAAGASCDFTCLAGPCHVECEGNNPRCTGQCANGDCTCTAGSACQFVCIDHNCHINCEAGSQCVLECPDGDAGKGCDFTMCGAGTSTACPDGHHVTCGAACP